jgi:uncharacterized protein YndB with AHSA1/START domain
MLVSLAVLLTFMPARPDPVRAADLNPVVHSIVVDASASEVWKAWTTSEGAASWMVAQADIDLRIGGLMRTHYDKTGKLGDAGTIENQILSFDPERMLSIRTVKTPERFPFKKAIQSMWTVIYLEPVEAHKTRVTVRSLGFAADVESQQMRAFFDRGNKITVDALAARFRESTRK